MVLPPWVILLFFIIDFAARTSTLYDTNGDEISETATTKKADYVKYEDIPQNFVNCMVSIEDKNFYKHNGVDIKAIVRARR